MRTDNMEKNKTAIMQTKETFILMKNSWRIIKIVSLNYAAGYCMTLAFCLILGTLGLNENNFFAEIT